MSNVIILDDEYFRVDFPSMSWDAKISSVDSTEKLLACVYHFLCKNPEMIKKEILAEIIDEFSERFNFKISTRDCVNSSIVDLYGKFSDSKELLSYVLYYLEKLSVENIDICKLIATHEKVFNLSWDAFS